MGQLPGIVERVRQVAFDQPDTLGDGDCEALRDGLIGQPTNTVTSLAFVGVGAWLAARINDLPESSRRGAVSYAALVALTGVGSVAYHGPQFAGAQSLHDLPIVGVFGIGVAVPLWRLRRGRPALPGWSRGRALGLAAAGAVAGTAYVVGGTDSSLCRPRSLLQPHGLWHLGTATVIALWGATVWAPTAAPPMGVVADLAPSAVDIEGADHAEH